MTAILLEIWLAIWRRVKLVGYFFWDNPKVLWATVLIIALGLFLWRSCRPKPAKLNESEIIAAQQAIEKQDAAKLKEILANADVREAQIDANLANSETQKLNALADARKKYDAMSNEDLAKEIEARK